LPETGCKCRENSGEKTGNSGEETPVDGRDGYVFFFFLNLSMQIKMNAGGRGEGRMGKRGKLGRLCWLGLCRLGRLSGKIKRPSVETEGRLTIACHMKNLRKIDVVLFAGYHLVRRPDKDKN
jgi:hypothetical protein